MVILAEIAENKGVNGEEKFYGIVHRTPVETQKRKFGQY